MYTRRKFDERFRDASAGILPSIYRTDCKETLYNQRHICVDRKSALTQMIQLFERSEIGATLLKF